MSAISAHQSDLRWFHFAFKHHVGMVEAFLLDKVSSNTMSCASTFKSRLDGNFEKLVAATLALCGIIDMDATDDLYYNLDEPKMTLKMLLKMLQKTPVAPAFHYLRKKKKFA